MGAVPPPPSQIYAKDDTGAKGVIQYQPTATELADVDIRGFTQEKLNAFFETNIPVDFGKKRRFALGDITKLLPPTITVLVPQETYSMIDVYKPTNRKKNKLGPPLNLKKRTNLKLAPNLVPELANIQLTNTAPSEGENDNQEKKQIQQRIEEYFRELAHEGEFIHDILDFESKYLGWITKEDSKYKSTDEQRIVRSSMKLLFQFIFSGATINDANSYYQHITIGYTKLMPKQKLPCNTDIRADFITTLKYRIETLSQEILEQAKGLGIIPPSEDKLRQEIFTQAKGNLFLHSSVNALKEFEAFVKYVEGDKEAWCMVYGDVAPMTVTVSEKALEQGIKQGVTDQQAELLLRLFRTFVQTTKEARTRNFAYPTFLGMMKNFSKIPDDGERQQGQEVFSALVDHLDTMISPNAQAYLDDMKRHILLLQELLMFVVRAVKSDNVGVSDETLGKMITELDEKFGGNPDLQGIKDVLKSVQSGTKEEQRAELKKATDELQGTIATLEAEIAELKKQLEDAKALGEQNEDLQTKLGEVVAAKQGLDTLLAEIRKSIGVQTNEQIVAAIEALKAEKEQLQKKCDEELGKLKAQQQGEITTKQADLAKQLEAKQKEFDEQKGVLEGKIAAAEAKVKELERGIDAATAKADAAEATLRAKEGELGAARAAIAGFEQQVAGLEAQTSAEQKAAIEAAKQAVSTATAEAEAARVELATLRAELVNIQERHATEIAKLKEENTAAITALEGRHATAIADLKREHAAAITELNTQIARLTTQKDEATAAAAGAKTAAEADVAEEVAAAQAEVARLKGEIEAATAAAAAAEAAATQKAKADVAAILAGKNADIQSLRVELDKEGKGKVAALAAAEDARKKLLTDAATKLARIEELEKSLDDAEAAKTAEIQEATTRAKAAEAALAALQQNKNRNAAVFQQQLAEAKAEKAAAEAGLVKTRAEIEAAQKQFDDLMRSKEEAEGKKAAEIAALQAKIQAADQAAAGAIAKQKDLEGAIAAKQAELNAARTKVTGKNANVAAKAAEITGLKDALKKAEQATAGIAAVQAQLDAAQKQKQINNSELQTRGATIATLGKEKEAAAAAAAAEVQAAQEQQQKLQAELAALQARLTAAEEAAAASRAKNSELANLTAKLATAEKIYEEKLLKQAGEYGKQISALTPAPSLKRIEEEKAAAIANAEALRKQIAELEASSIKALVTQTEEIASIQAALSKTEAERNEARARASPERWARVAQIDGEQKARIAALEAKLAALQAGAAAAAPSAGAAANGWTTGVDKPYRGLVGPGGKPLGAVSGVSSAGTATGFGSSAPRFSGASGAAAQGQSLVDKGLLGRPGVMRQAGMASATATSGLGGAEAPVLSEFDKTKAAFDARIQSEATSLPGYMENTASQAGKRPTPSTLAPQGSRRFQAFTGGGKNQNQSICESLLAALLFKADQIAEADDPEFEVEALVDKAGATLDDLGQCPLVLDLLMRLLQETPQYISPLRALKQGLTFHKTQLDDETQAQLDMLEDSYNKRFNSTEKKILTQLSPPLTLYARVPEQYQELLGSQPYVLEENDMDLDDDEIPLHGLDDDIVLTEQEQEMLENTGHGGIPLGALMFLYTLCLKDVLSREEHPTLNSKCRLLTPQRTVERAKTPKVSRTRTPKLRKSTQKKTQKGKQSA